MPKIKLVSDYYGSEVRVNHKDFGFIYFIADKGDSYAFNGNKVRKGTKELTLEPKGSNWQVTMTLNGKQIKTLKKILKAAGEI